MTTVISVIESPATITAPEVVTVISEQCAGIQGTPGTNGTPVLINTISFTGVSFVTMDNIFSSSYTDYEMVVNFTSYPGLTSTSFQFRRSGSTLNSAVYSVQTANMSTSYGGSGSTTATSVDLAGSGVVTGFNHTLEFHNPFVSTKETGYKSHWLSEYIANVQRLVAGRYRTAQTIDGLNLNFAGTTCTGTIRIYGKVN